MRKERNKGKNNSPSSTTVTSSLREIHVNILLLLRTSNSPRAPLPLASRRSCSSIGSRRCSSGRLSNTSTRSPALSRFPRFYRTLGSRPFFSLLGSAIESRGASADCGRDGSIAMTGRKESVAVTLNDSMSRVATNVMERLSRHRVVCYAQRVQRDRGVRTRRRILQYDRGRRITRLSIWLVTRLPKRAPRGMQRRWWRRLRRRLWGRLRRRLRRRLGRRAR